ncbi:MAG TPA: glycosyltransferase family 2 protein [Bacilli bacterium]
MKTCIVVIPAYNEQDAIAGVIAQIPRAAMPGYEVKALVVNDGSGDATVKRAREAGADYIYSTVANQGLGAAVYFGLKEAYRLGADIVVMIDADNEYPAAEIPHVAAPIVNGEADYVIGSRFMRKVRGMKLYRRWGNRAFTLLVSLLLRRRLSDGQSGMRAFSRAVCRDVDIIHAYNYAQVMTLNIVRQGYRLREVPISYKVRTTGESFIRFNYLARVIPAICKEMLTPVENRRGVQTPYALEFHKAIVTDKI